MLATLSISVILGGFGAVGVGALGVGALLSSVAGLAEEEIIGWEGNTACGERPRVDCAGNANSPVAGVGNLKGKSSPQVLKSLIGGGSIGGVCGPNGGVIRPTIGTEKRM
eukprot:GDKJ01029003.1.p2 GENE.GDKJ01029003.1~~GDKJ01029003.1.p2  ORF type:complete len:110 (-),score=3.28 GDKJ01029003.1:88-417(-)